MSFAALAPIHGLLIGWLVVTKGSRLVPMNRAALHHYTIQYSTYGHNIRDYFAAKKLKQIKLIVAPGLQAKLRGLALSYRF